MIKAVLFDLDGTLLNTNDLIIKSFTDTFKHYYPDREFTYQEIIDCIGPTLEQTAMKYYPQNISEMVGMYRHHYVLNHDELIKIYPGIEEMLKALKDLGLKLAIVTSKKRDMTLKAMEHTNVLDYFDLIISSDEVTQPKPHQEPIELALKELNLLKDEVIMVGDNSHDIECANHASVKSIAVGWALKGADYLRGFNPTYIINTADELIEIIKKEGVQ